LWCFSGAWAAMMETDEKARLSRYKTRVSRYKKNVAVLCKMAEIEELDGFKTQILNLVESYVRLIESIDRWKTSLENKSSSSVFADKHPTQCGNAPGIENLRWPSR
jgi:hypothetical protein